jgi:hypothetical protein
MVAWLGLSLARCCRLPAAIPLDTSLSPRSDRQATRLLREPLFTPAHSNKLFLASYLL